MVCPLLDFAHSFLCCVFSLLLKWCSFCCCYFCWHRLRFLLFPSKFLSPQGVWCSCCLCCFLLLLCCYFCCCYWLCWCCYLLVLSGQQFLPTRCSLTSSRTNLLAALICTWTLTRSSSNHNHDDTVHDDDNHEDNVDGNGDCNNIITIMMFLKRRRKRAIKDISGD